MMVHFGIEQLKPEWRSSVVCVGTFDGIHLGHRELILRTVSRARELESPSLVVTFDRHPASILAPEHVPPAISTLEQNLGRFEDLGVSCTVILPFDKRFSLVSAAEFFENVLRNRLRAETVVVGHDFAFGAGREGDGEWLKSRIETEVVDALLMDGHRVSSSAIRSSILGGDLAMANRFLGHYYAIRGVVVAGQKLGRKLGYPTLNLARSHPQILPGDGVYAGVARTMQGEFLAAVSIGLRPTVDGKDRTVEAYLLDFPGGDLYGTVVELAFVKKIRDEMKFSGLDSLTKAIANDVEQVREIGWQALGTS